MMMNSVCSYLGAYSSICLIREVTLQELTVDWAKLEALSINDLVHSICINLIDDIRSLPFRSKSGPCFMGCDDWSS